MLHIYCYKVLETPQPTARYFFSLSILSYYSCTVGGVRIIIALMVHQIVYKAILVVQQSQKHHSSAATTNHQHESIALVAITTTHVVSNNNNNGREAKR